MARFSAPFQTGPEAHPASYTMGTVPLLGVKWPGRGEDHPLPCSTKVKKKRAILLIPVWAFEACSRVNFNKFSNSLFGFIYTCFLCSLCTRKKCNFRINYAYHYGCGLGCYSMRMRFPSFKVTAMACLSVRLFSCILCVVNKLFIRLFTYDLLVDRILEVRRRFSFSVSTTSPLLLIFLYFFRSSSLPLRLRSLF